MDKFELIKRNTEEIIAEDELKELLNITKGSIIEIEGKVVEYKEKLEINADLIRI